MESIEESKKVIFLDIDGVLATCAEYGHFGNKETNKFQEEKKNKSTLFQKDVEILNEICNIR